LCFTRDGQHLAVPMRYLTDAVNFLGPRTPFSSHSGLASSASPLRVWWLWASMDRIVHSGC